MNTHTPIHTFNPHQDLLDKIGSLRLRAWASTEPSLVHKYPNGIWTDNFDKTSHHWHVTENNALICSARLTISTKTSNLPDGHIFKKFENHHYTKAIISRLVVSPTHRRKGLARLIDKVRIDMAMKAGVDIIFAISDYPRVPHLNRLGFKIVGEPFEIAPWKETSNIPLALETTQNGIY